MSSSISPDLDFFYRPLSVGEPFGVGEVLRFDLPSLARGCGATHRLGTLTSVDADAQRGPDESKRNVRLRRTPDRDRRASPRGGARRAHVPRRDRRTADQGMLSDIDRGVVERVAFALPGGATWPLPLYELALLTADHARVKASRRAGDHDRDAGGGARSSLLGREAGEASGATHGARNRVSLDDVPGLIRAGRAPDRARAGRYSVDTVVSIAAAQGRPARRRPPGRGLLHPGRRELPRSGLEDVFAAGDITTFPVKQGGSRRSRPTCRRRDRRGRGRRRRPGELRPCASRASPERLSALPPGRAERRARISVDRGSGARSGGLRRRSRRAISARIWPSTQGSPYGPRGPASLL